MTGWSSTTWPTIPTEQANVAAQHPEVVADLSDRLHHWVSAQLGGRPDPMHSVIDAGLPAVARLNDVMAELARPRPDEEPASVPEPEPAPVGMVEPPPSSPPLVGTRPAVA